MSVLNIFLSIHYRSHIIHWHTNNSIYREVITECKYTKQLCIVGKMSTISKLKIEIFIDDNFKA